MEAGLLDRLPLDRLTRPFGGSVAEGARGLRPRAGSMRRARRRARKLIAAHRQLRIALLCVAVGVPLLCVGWLTLRHSSLVAVEHVRVSGVQGPQAREIEVALTEAARGMSTMDVSDAKLRAAVARFPVVQDVRASASFPHSLRITVIEQQPVAALVVAGSKTAVAANGVVLGPELLSSSLPTLNAGFEPPRGQRLHDVTLLESLTVLGAAPPALAKLVARVEQGPHGLTVAMQNGLLVYFGNADRPHAKWLSLARVLADKSSEGATYVDVRLPGRPAAGFSEVSTPTASSTQAGGSESAVSALAAGLTGGKTEASTGEPGEAQSGSSTESSQASGAGEAGGEASSGEAGGEASTPSEVGEASTSSSEGATETGG